MRTPTAHIAIGSFLAALLSGCIPREEEDYIAPNYEHTWISTVLLKFISSGGAEVKYITLFSHENEGTSPTMNLDALSMDTVYNVSIEVWSSNCNPGQNTTPTIEAEGDRHQFFYVPDGVDLTITYADTDVNGLPIGIATVWSAGASTGGGVRVVLRSGLDKNDAGVSGGDLTNAGGETDLDWIFPVVIQ